MKIEKDTFNKYVEDNVFKTINEYNLIEDNENIMIGVSGGKDSILTLNMLKKYQETSNIDFNLKAVCIDEGISGYRRDGIIAAKDNCKKLGIPLYVHSFKEEWGRTLDKISDVYKSTCMPCGVYRRHLLNKISDFHGADKIATGHNMDDEIQSFLMTFARNDKNKFSKFGPKLKRIHPNMTPRIKPLWQLPEKDVGIWCVVNDIEIHEMECPYAQSSLRANIKAFLNSLEEESNGIKRNIFNSFKKTFMENKKLDSEKAVKLTLCERCNQPTATSPCNACKITDEIDELL